QTHLYVPDPQYAHAPLSAHYPRRTVGPDRRPPRPAPTFQPCDRDPVCRYQSPTGRLIYFRIGANSPLQGEGIETPLPARKGERGGVDVLDGAPRLEQHVDERRERRALEEHDQEREQRDGEHERLQPPVLPLPDEAEQLPHRVDLRHHAVQRPHPAPPPPGRGVRTPASRNPRAISIPTATCPSQKGWAVSMNNEFRPVNVVARSITGRCSSRATSLIVAL